MARVRRFQFLEPMKALPGPVPPDDGQWIYEVKFDGFRVLAVKNGGEVELWSRNRKPLKARFPAVAAAVARLAVPACILDGEVCALDARGISSFQLLQNQAESASPLVYYVFDLPAEGTSDLRSLPLLERKGRLEVLLRKAADPIRLSGSFTGPSRTILGKMEAAGAEGAIAKRADSTYEAGRRSGAWVKIKFHKEQEFVVAGYTAPKKSRSHFGALLLAYYRGGHLVYAGRVGTGFSERMLGNIFRKLRPLECSTPAVDNPPAWKPSETHWVRPVLIAQVRFTEWTGDGILRHPSFLGLRDDKNPAEVVRE